MRDRKPWIKPGPSPTRRESPTLRRGLHPWPPKIRHGSSREEKTKNIRTTKMHFTLDQNCVSLRWTHSTGFRTTSMKPPTAPLIIVSHCQYPYLSLLLTSIFVSQLPKSYLHLFVRCSKSLRSPTPSLLLSSDSLRRANLFVMPLSLDYSHQLTRDRIMSTLPLAD